MVVVIVFGFPSTNSSTFETANCCVAQTQPVPQEQQPDLAKAMKYHSALLRRPNPGYLYDRFYNAWLDSSSQESLRTFLVSRSKAPDAESADRLLLAFFYVKQGNNVAALQQFRVALKNNPDNPATLYQMAIIEARTFDFESALKNLAQAARANSVTEESIKIAELRGKLLVRNGQTEEAFKVWDELISSNPDDLVVMEDLIELQITEKMLDRAEALSDRLIAATKDPTQKVIRQLRKADILKLSDKQASALEVYGRTLDQVGMDSWIEREILSQVDQLFRRDDDLVGLNEYLVKLIETDDKRVAIRTARAKILMELGQIDEGIESYEKVIELTPGSRENREAFVNLLIQADKPDRAVQQMESLVIQHPKDAELQIRLAELCYKTSAPDKAKEALENNILLSGSTEYSYLRAARLFEKFNDVEAAKSAYDSALSKFQDSDSVKESWADFLFRTGSKDEAVKVWQALAKDADRARVIQIARLVSTRQLNQVAMDLLLARYDDFKLDSNYLGQLCSEAIALEAYDQAVPWVIARLRSAQTNSDLDNAFSQALRIISNAEQTEAVIQSLRIKENRASVETCLLVEMLERSSQKDEAERVLQTSFEASKAANLNQDTQVLARQRVRLAKGRLDWATAAKVVREMIELPGGRTAQNVRQLIQLYERVGDDESALQWIVQWKRLSPNSVQPWLSEAELLERVDKTTEAIAVLRRATQTFTDDRVLPGLLAKKYLSVGQTRNATRIFWRQYEESEILSDKIRWAEQLAKVADYEGEMDQLIANFEERHQNNPRSIEPLLSLAQAHRIAGNYEQRRAALLEATQLKKNDLLLLLEIAKLEESEGDWQRAIQTLQQASLIDESNRTKQKIARTYLRYGETKQGIDWLVEIAGGENSTAEDTEEISELIAMSGNWEELLEFSAVNQARFPNNYRFGYLKAIANEELGKTDAATDQFIKLLTVDQEIAPDNANQNDPRPSASDQGPADVYWYRQTSRGGYSTSVAKRHLPNTLENLKAFSLIHLIGMNRDFPQEQRDELQRQLEQINANDAQGFENYGKAFKALSKAGFAVVRNNASPLSVVSLDQIKRLSRAGKKDAAARLLMPEFRWIARQVLDLNSNKDGEALLQEFKEKVEELGLARPLLILAEPQSATNPRKLGAWAVAQETFGSKEDAATAYEKLLKARPRETAARLRYVLSNPLGDRQLFSRQFSKVDKRFRKQFLTALLEQMKQDVLSASDKQSLAEAIIIFREGEEARSIDDDSFATLLKILASEISINANGYGDRLPMVYYRVSNEKSDTNEGGNQVRANELLAKQKRDLHDRVALALTDSREPGLAETGFAALLRSTEAAGRPIDDNILKLALKTAYAVKKPAARRRQQDFFVTRTNENLRGTTAANLVIKRTPVEFLARYYGLSDVDHDKQIELIASKLETLGAKRDAIQLRKTYRMCRASDEEFVKIAGEMIDAAKGNLEHPNYQAWRAALTTAIEAWTSQNLQVDISQFVIDYAACESDSPVEWEFTNKVPYQNDGDLLIDFLQTFALRNDLSKVDEFLTELRLQMIGSEAKQQELSKLLVDQSSVVENYEQLVPLGNYWRLVGRLDSRKAIWLGMEEMQRFPFPHQNLGFFPTRLKGYISEYKKTEVDALLGWLRQSKVMGGIAEFSPCQVIVNEEELSVWGYVIRPMRFNYDKKISARITRQLSKKAKRSKLTFGEKVFLSFLKVRPTNIYKLLGAEVDTFNTLPQKQQIRLARFAAEIDRIDEATFGRSGLIQPLTDAGSKAVRKKCLRLMNPSATPALVALMKMEKFSDLGIQPVEFNKWATQLLQTMSVDDPEQLLAAVEKISEIGSTPELDGRIITRGNYQVLRPRKAKLIESVIVSDISFDSMKLMLIAFEKDNLQDLGLSEQTSAFIAQFLKQKYANAVRTIRKQNKKLPAPVLKAKAMKQIVDLLGGQFGDRDLSVFIPELTSLCTPIKRADAIAVSKWLHSNDAEKFPNVKKTFQLAFDCSRDKVFQWRPRDKAKRPKRDQQTEGHSKEILDFIDDDSIALQSRSRVAMYLVRYDTLSSEGVARCCQVVADGCDAGTQFENISVKRAFTALNNAGDSPGTEDAKLAFAKSWALSMTPQPASLYYRGNTLDSFNVLAANGEKAAALKLLSKQNDTLFAELPYSMIEFGYYPEAKERCEALWANNWSLAFTKGERNKFSKALESNLPKFLERFKEEGSRFFAELYFSSLPNPDNADGIISTVESRLTALVNRFSNVKFSSKRDRQASLIFLARSGVNLKAIDQALTDEVKDISIESLFKSDERSLDIQLFGSYLSVQNQLGNFEPVQTHWKKANELFKTKYPNQWPQEILHVLEEIITDSFDKLLRDRTPEQIAEILPVLRDLNNPTYLRPLSPLGNDMAHLMAGRVDELIKFNHERNANVKSDNAIVIVDHLAAPQSETSNMNDFIFGFKYPFEQIKSTDPQVKSTLIVNAWRYGSQQNFSFGLKSFEDGTFETRKRSKAKAFGLDWLRQARMLNNKQLLEVGPELATINSLNGEIWLQLARRQVNASDFSAAAESFEKSIAAAKVDMKKAKFNRRVEYASALLKLKRTDEAKKMIAGIPVKQLFESNQVLLKKLQKLLK